MNELCMGLMVSETDTVAREVIDQIIEMCIECPKPADIRRLAFQKNGQLHPDPTDEQKWGGAPSLCRKCRGWGTVGDPPNATWCDCRDGNSVRTHPSLGDGWLRLVNRGKATGSPTALMHANEKSKPVGALERL